MRCIRVAEIRRRQCRVPTVLFSVGTLQGPIAPRISRQNTIDQDLLPNIKFLRRKLAISAFILYDPAM